MTLVPLPVETLKLENEPFYDVSSILTVHESPLRQAGTFRLRFYPI